MSDLLNAQTYEYTELSIAGYTDFDTIKRISRPEISVEGKKVRGTQNRETRRTGGNKSYGDIEIEMGKDEFNLFRKRLTGSLLQHINEYPFNIIGEVKPPNSLPEAQEKFTLEGCRCYKHKSTDITGEDDYTVTLTCTIDDFTEEEIT